MNIQFAIKDDKVYVLEVNPRASRTVPFLSKATGVPLAKAAARVMLGRTLAEIGLEGDIPVAGCFVKTPVFPFVRFHGRGRPARARDEVHRRGDGLRRHVRRRVRQGPGGGRVTSCRVAGTRVRSVNDSDKPTVLPIVRDLVALGFSLAATRGTAAFLGAHGLPAEVIYKVNEGRPNIADAVVNGQHLPGHQHAAGPGVVLRRQGAAPGGDAARRALHHYPHRRCRRGERHPRHRETRAEREVRALQDFHGIAELTRTAMRSQLLQLPPVGRVA